MSYCRNNGDDSDVYVYVMGTGNTDPTEAQEIWVCACNKPGNCVPSRMAMYYHLLEHREDGDKVPEDALDRLIREVKEEEKGKN